ncbi:MAG: hypothetical protein ACREI7_00415 [Myxococcota bacterium]
MLAWAIALWVVGLLTIVPYGTYHLLFHASRDQYAVLITLILFWIFGYWGVVGPLLATIKARRVFRAIERAATREDLLVVIRTADSREVATDFLASENHIPRFIAARVYDLLAARLSASAGGETRRTGSGSSSL